MPVIDLVTPDSTLPQRASVCIIGGGVAGISTALELAERGLDVVVLEKGQIAAEQSSRNWGWCRQMGRDPREIPLVRVALDAWDGMNARIGGETGFTRCGILYLCETEQELATRTKWFEESAKPFVLSTRMIGAAEAKGSALAGSALTSLRRSTPPSTGSALSSSSPVICSHRLRDRCRSSLRSAIGVVAVIWWDMT